MKKWTRQQRIKFWAAALRELSEALTKRIPESHAELALRELSEALTKRIPESHAELAARKPDHAPRSPRRARRRDL